MRNPSDLPASRQLPTCTPRQHHLWPTTLASIVLLACGALAPLQAQGPQGPQGPQSPPLASSNAPEAVTGRPRPHANLDATLWAQSSVEAQAAARQVYIMAGLRLQGVLRNKEVSAALEQRVPFSHLPPAIILDVDETILDNSPVQGRIIKSGKPWDSHIWEKWVGEASANALPGSVEFLRAVHKLGIKIFYVTNRSSVERRGTELNLRRHGFPVYPDGSNVLLIGDRPGWTSDKTSRRSFLASKYRILMLFGDDFNDFVGGAKSDLKTREALHQKHEARWGHTWFALSNPMYGSWERAITGYQGGTSAQMDLAAKFRTLRSHPTP